MATKVTLEEMLRYVPPAPFWVSVPEIKSRTEFSYTLIKNRLAQLESDGLIVSRGKDFKRIAPKSYQRVSKEVKIA